MMYSGLIDLFDGFFAKRAKRTPEASAAGPELDSLVDICAFGFAPAIFAYCFGLKGTLSIALLIAYIGVNALRLAYFNHAGLTADEQRNYYTGLPVTYAALFIPAIFTLRLLVPDETLKQILFCLYALLALAMVSSIRIRKLTGIWYAIFSAGALLLTIIYVRAILAQLP
jgi:CDP-diacylglycerol--serine O-phosphatidyltransferase